MTPRSRPWLCRAVLGTAVVVVLPLTAPTAWAAPPAGGVTALGCIQSLGGVECGATAPALNGASGVAVSPDGANVYVASAADDAVAIFSRGTGGSLTYAGCIKDTLAAVSCAMSVDGLDGPNALAVSPDGANVYVSSFAFGSDTLLTLDRGAAGALTDGGPCYRGVSGGPGSCSSIGSFDDPRGIAFSPDGGSLYVADSVVVGGITRFTRAPGGDLAFNGTSVAGILNAPYRVAVSSDGGTLYTAGTVSDDVVWIPRNPDGSLSIGSAGCLNQLGGGGCSGAAEGLEGAQGVAVSADNANVYVASPVRDTIALFTRGAGGALSAAGCIKNPASPASCSATAAGLDGAADVAVSPDGENVYVASQSPGNALVAFARGAGGTLTPINCVQNTGGAACGATAPGLDTPQALALSPDGLNIYTAAAALAGGAVAWFARNRAPSCSGASAETGAATPVTVPLSCSDANGDSLVRAIASAPANGALGQIDQAAGTVTYTPQSGFSGTDSFSFTGSDGGGTSPPATVTITVGAPLTLSDLAVVPKRFRRGSRLPRLARRTRTGATIRFTLSEAASVELSFERARPGRRVGSKCRRPKRGQKRRNRCTRYVRAGTLSVNGSAGANKLRFYGRLSRRKKLPVGRYRLAAVPTSLTGVRGASSDTSFKLLRRARRR